MVEAHSSAEMVEARSSAATVAAHSSAVKAMVDSSAATMAAHSSAAAAMTAVHSSAAAKAAYPCCFFSHNVLGVVWEKSLH